MKKILFMRLGGAVKLGIILSIFCTIVIGLTGLVYKTSYSGLRETDIRLEGQQNINTNDISDIEGEIRAINTKLDERFGSMQKSLDRIERKLWNTD